MPKNSTFSFVKNSANDQSPSETLNILSYELGELSNCYISAMYATSAKDSDLYDKVAFGEMSDLISMSRMFCEQVGWDYEHIKPKQSFVYSTGDISNRALILLFITKQVGKVSKCSHYVKVFGENLQGDGATEMANLRAACERYALLMGWDFKELMDHGQEKYLDKMRDIKNSNKLNQSK